MALKGKYKEPATDRGAERSAAALSRSLRCANYLRQTTVVCLPTLQAVAAILVTPFRPSGALSRPTAFSVLDRDASQPAGLLTRKSSAAMGACPVQVATRADAIYYRVAQTYKEWTQLGNSPQPAASNCDVMGRAGR